MSMKDLSRATEEMFWRANCRELMVVCRLCKMLSAVENGVKIVVQKNLSQNLEIKT